MITRLEKKNVRLFEKKKNLITLIRYYLNFLGGQDLMNYFQ